MKALLSPSCLAFFLVLTFSVSAQAEFVQTTTCNPTGPPRCAPGEEPLPVHWRKLEVYYYIHDQGSQDLHPGTPEITDELRDSVIESFDTWNDQTCSNFTMLYAGDTPDAPIGTDGGRVAIENLTNVVVWRDGQWPHPGYGAVALTTVTFRPSSGEILAADIEFNTADYTFTDLEGTEGTVIDLRNTLTHEAGHFLGLDHTGNPQATMFATAPPGEISKRTLHPVDISGLCYIYPLDLEFEDPPDADAPEDDTGRRGCFRSCSTIPGDDDLPPFALFITLIGGFLIFRRFQGSPSLMP